LQSQEHRCRDYAAARGYDVEAAFDATPHALMFRGTKSRR
jgi:hypothetical protein